LAGLQRQHDHVEIAPGLDKLGIDSQSLPALFGCLRKPAGLSQRKTEIVMGLREIGTAPDQPFKDLQSFF
jgi:hypothetical protein